MIGKTLFVVVGTVVVADSLRDGNVVGRISFMNAEGDVEGKNVVGEGKLEREETTRQPNGNKNKLRFFFR